MVNSFKKSQNSKTSPKRRSVKRRSVKRRILYDGKTEDGYKIIFISDVSGSMNTKYLNDGKDDFYINTVNNFTNTINNKDILLAFDHDCVKYTGDKTSTKLKAYGLTDMRTFLPDLKKEIDSGDKIKIYLSSDGLHNVTDLKTLFNKIYNVFKSSEKEPSGKEIHWIIRCYGNYSPEKILTTIAYMITSFYKSKFNCTITPVDDNNFKDFKDTDKYIQIPEEYYNTFIEKIVLNRLKDINFQHKNEFINPIIEKINKTMEKLKDKIWEDIWNAIYSEDLSLNIPKTLKEFDNIIYLIIDKYNSTLSIELRNIYIAVYLELLKSDPSIESINLKIDPTKINIKPIDKKEYKINTDNEFLNTTIDLQTVKDIVFDLLFNKNYEPYLILKVKYLILDKSIGSKYLVTKNELKDYIIDPKYLILPLPMGGNINNCLEIKSNLLKNDGFIKSIAKNLNYENVTDVTFLFGKIIESFLEYYIYSNDITEDDKIFCEKLTNFFIINFYDTHVFFNSTTFEKNNIDAKYDFNTIQGQPQDFVVSRTQFDDLVILTVYIYIVQNKFNLHDLQPIIKSFANFGTKPEDTDFKDEQASLRIYPLSILYIYNNSSGKKCTINEVGESDKKKIENYINKAFISIPKIERYETQINNEYKEILEFFMYSNENLPTLFRSLIKHFDYDPNNNDLEIIAKLLVLKLNEDGRSYTNNIVDLESDDNFSKFFADCKNNINNKLYYNASSSVYESLVSKKKALWFYLDIFQLKKSFLISCKKLSKIYGIETKKIDQLTITWNAMHDKIINFKYNRKYEMKETRRLALPSLSIIIDDITMNKITRNWEFATITEENICKYIANKEINIKYKNGLNILNIGTTDSKYLNKFIELFYPLGNINTLISYIYNYKKEYTEKIYEDYLDNFDSLNDRKKIENNIQLKDNYKFVLSEIYKFYTQIKTLKELKDCEKSTESLYIQEKEKESEKRRKIRQRIQEGIEKGYIEGGYESRETYDSKNNYMISRGLAPDYDIYRENLLNIINEKEKQNKLKRTEEIRKEIKIRQRIQEGIEKEEKERLVKEKRLEEEQSNEQPPEEAKQKLDGSGKSMKRKRNRISRKKKRSIRHNALFKKIKTRKSRKN